MVVILDSTVDTFSASGGSGRIASIFYFAADSNPEVFFLPSVPERRSVPSRCFWLQSCSAWFALGHLEFLFASFTWLSCVVTDVFFSPLSAAFFGLLFGVEALVCQLTPVAC